MSRVVNLAACTSEGPRQARLRNSLLAGVAFGGLLAAGALGVPTGEAGVAPPTCFGQEADIYRPDSAFVQGTDKGEVIVTGGPQNQIKAGGGDDVICSGGNKDVVTAGGGNDRIDLGSGTDIVKAGSGNDLASGRGGKDLLNGGSGDDDLFGRDGNDTLDGKSGKDLCVGGKGADIASVDRCEVVRGAVTG